LPAAVALHLRTFLPLRLGSIAGLFLPALLILFLDLLVLVRRLGFVLTIRLRFILLGLGFSLFLPRRFLFLLLFVLRVDKSCTSDQHPENC
jgi:hypothetical protein